MTNPNPDGFRFTVKSDLAQVSVARQKVLDYALALGLPQREAWHCELAVDEACTNIIEHGYHPLGMTGEIAIHCYEKQRYLHIVIRDNAPPYNPLSTPEGPVLAAADDFDVTGGWGVYFIRRVMDSVDYRYSEGANELRLAKRIP